MWHRIPSVTEHINMSSVTGLIICHHLEGRWDCVWAYAYTSINDDITCHDCIKHVWMYIEYNERNKINLPRLMQEHIHTYICVYIYICVSAYIYMWIWRMDHIRFTAYDHMECIWNRICEYGCVDINYMAACHVRLKHVYMYREYIE